MFCDDGMRVVLLAMFQEPNAFSDTELKTIEMSSTNEHCVMPLSSEGHLS